MKRSLCGLLILVMAATNLVASSKPVPAPDYSTIDVERNPRLVYDRRFELEMRRAGGPRPEVIEDLLKIGEEINDPQWGKRVIDACRDRIVDCNEFVAAAGMRADREKRYPEWAKGLARRIVEEAAFQRMTVKQRRAFYLEALEKGRSERDGIQLDAANAAHRILGEAMYDLVGEIEKARMESRFSHSDRLDREIKIGKALTSGDPKGRLIELVRQGVLQPTGSLKALFAEAALNELRRLNLEGTVEQLKEVLELYEPARKRQLKEIREQSEKAQAESRYLLSGTLPAADAYLGVLGKEIIEAIGDLGDRQFEKKALGGRTLWDQVNEAERELVQRGRLHRNDMVSR